MQTRYREFFLLSTFREAIRPCGTLKDTYILLGLEGLALFGFLRGIRGVENNPILITSEIPYFLTTARLISRAVSNVSRQKIAEIDALSTLLKICYSTCILVSWIPDLKRMMQKQSHSRRHRVFLSIFFSDVDSYSHSINQSFIFKPLYSEVKTNHSFQRYWPREKAPNKNRRCLF